MPLRIILLVGFGAYPGKWIIDFFSLYGQARIFTFLMVVLAAGYAGVWTHRGVWVGRLMLNAAGRTLVRVFRTP